VSGAASRSDRCGRAHRAAFVHRSTRIVEETLASRNQLLLLCLFLGTGLAAAASLPAHAFPNAFEQAHQLTEPHEHRANSVQPPELVMELVGVRPGLVIGEVGAGRGRVTVHLAARVGPAGKVYANDIDERALDYLKGRVERLGLGNVETVLSTPDDTRFPAGILDMVFMEWVFHHVDEPVPLLKSALGSLKPSGRVVLVEPIPARTEPDGRVLTRERVEQEARAAGLTLDTMMEGRLQEDNIFILRPSAPSQR
jgi:SAM-dependent methyltransferase